jgi:predicted secreted protein
LSGKKEPTLKIISKETFNKTCDVSSENFYTWFGKAASSGYLRLYKEYLKATEYRDINYAKGIILVQPNQDVTTGTIIMSPDIHAILSEIEQKDNCNKLKFIPVSDSDRISPCSYLNFNIYCKTTDNNPITLNQDVLAYQIRKKFKYTPLTSYMNERIFLYFDKKELTNVKGIRKIILIPTDISTYSSQFIGSNTKFSFNTPEHPNIRIIRPPSTPQSFEFEHLIQPVAKKQPASPELQLPTPEYKQSGSPELQLPYHGYQLPSQQKIIHDITYPLINYLNNQPCDGTDKVYTILLHGHENSGKSAIAGIITDSIRENFELIQVISPGNQFPSQLQRTWKNCRSVDSSLIILDELEILTGIINPHQYDYESMNLLNKILRTPIRNKIVVIATTLFTGVNQSLRWAVEKEIAPANRKDLKVILKKQGITNPFSKESCEKFLLDKPVGKVIEIVSTGKAVTNWEKHISFYLDN